MTLALVLAALLVGATFGFLTAALLAAASRSDTAWIPPRPDRDDEPPTIDRWERHPTGGAAA